MALLTGTCMMSREAEQRFFPPSTVNTSNIVWPSCRVYVQTMRVFACDLLVRHAALPEELVPRALAALGAWPQALPSQLRGSDRGCAGALQSVLHALLQHTCLQAFAAGCDLAEASPSAALVLLGDRRRSRAEAARELWAVGKQWWGWPEPEKNPTDPLPGAAMAACKALEASASSGRLADDWHCLAPAIQAAAGALGTQWSCDNVRPFTGGTSNVAKGPLRK